MIGKIIRMNRRRRRALPKAFRKLRDSVFALTRYIVDADPYSLIAELEDDVLSLSDYALAIQAAGIEPGEKVEAWGVRNLQGEDLSEWQAEMLAVAASASSIKTPLIHIIISLKEGETWSEEQREEAIDILLGVLGLERCQVLWAEHSNTTNAHLHLAIVRVDLITGQAAGTDWLIDDLHQGLALVEEAQGRAPEAGALYIARNGAVFDADTDIMVRDAQGQFISGWYKELGRKHDRVPAIMRPRRANIIEAAQGAQSWSALHGALEELGVTYERSGSGARIALEGRSAKASEVHASLSRPELEKRLGPFEPDIARLNPEYEAYRSAFDTQLKGLRQSREEERARLAQWVNATIGSMPSGASRDLTAAIRNEGKAADEAIAESFKIAIARHTKHRLSEEAWAKGGRPAAPPQVLAPSLLLPIIMDGSEISQNVETDLTRTQNGWATDYHHPDGTKLFTDHRILIIVHAPDRHDAIDEALSLAAARWGSVSAKGSDQFLQLVVERAAKLNIRVVDAAGIQLRPNESTPSPSVALPAPPVDVAPAREWTVPDVEADPVRQQRVQEAIDFLDNFDGLLLGRRLMDWDTKKSGRTGPLEVVLNDDAYDRRNEKLNQHALFDDNPLVQQFLERKRMGMLEGCRELALGSSLEPEGLTPSSVREILPKQYEVRRPAFFAAEDHDFLEMLREVREQMLNIRSQAAAAPKAPNREVPLQRERALQHEVETGVSIKDQMDHLAKQAERDG